MEKLYKVGEGEGRGDEGESVDNFVLSKRMWWRNTLDLLVCLSSSLIEWGGRSFPTLVGLEFSFVASLSSLNDENKELYDSKLSSEASLRAGLSEIKDLKAK